jgi:hypothetical protein
VAAPLAVYLALQRPARRDQAWAVVCALLAVLLCLGPADDFEQLERAWLVLLTGGLAVTLLIGRRRGFAMSSLQTLGGAGVAAGVLMIVTRLSWADVAGMAQHHFFLYFRALVDLVAPVGNPGREFFNDTALSVLRVASRVMPGFVLLQSFAAMALAWALYQRIAREPQGEPLPSLSAFRFNDHLIWGVAISLLALVVPRLVWARALGGNLLLFFGGLYLVRGFAVLTTLAAAIGVGYVIMLLVTLFLWPVVALMALALGLTDTLVDWRVRLARAVHKP